MEHGFKQLQEYETHRPQYGSIKLDFDPLQYTNEAYEPTKVMMQK